MTKQETEKREETREKFMADKITTTKGNIVYARNELGDKSRGLRQRAILERFIKQQQRKLELYQEGKLDIDAEVSLKILLGEI